MTAVPSTGPGSNGETGAVDVAERSADWCDDYGSFAVCGTDMVEHSRDSMGVRWCFHCRKRHEFWWVVMVPAGISYYGPSADVDGIHRDCTDLFPGWTREREDD